jgi:hypothetical protein
MFAQAIVLLVNIGAALMLSAFVLFARSYATAGLSWKDASRALDFPATPEGDGRRVRANRFRTFGRALVYGGFSLWFLGHLGRLVASGRIRSRQTWPMVAWTEWLLLVLGCAMMGIATVGQPLNLPVSSDGNHARVRARKLRRGGDHARSSEGSLIAWPKC